jgi:hypothetical protein
MQTSCKFRSYYNTARDHESNRMTGDEQFDWRDCIGQYRLYYLVRSLHVLAVLLCSLNVIARIVLASYRAEKAALYDEAAAACDADGRDARSPSAVQDWKSRDAASSENREKSLFATRFLEAFVLVLMAAGFLLFFPACIVMLRRVERRLDAIIRDIALRSNAGNVLLPFEFSPAGADGVRTQEEMTVVDARNFLHRMKWAAASQSRRFLLCLVLVLAALAAQSSHALFVSVAFSEKRNPACAPCGTCQRVERLMAEWHELTFEVWPLVASLCSTTPLMFSLWLMTTKEDRELMLHPHRFLVDQIALHSGDSEAEMRLKAERVRMGVELR